MTESSPGWSAGCTATRLSILVAVGATAAALALFASCPPALAQNPPLAKAGDSGARAVFPDARDRPPPGWTGPVFRLSQDYPQFPPKAEDYPWKEFDFRTQYKEYLAAVLKYCLEGNVEVDWDVSKNTVRKWYHAPWLHWGRNGREFVHGLTHERVALPEELARTQTGTFQNWAVGMYNAPGGYVLGRVWRDPDNPDPAAARFPEGTVAVKLLFTQAPVSQVPYLKGAKEWEAYIYESTVIPTNPLGRRTFQTVRLLQIDVGVRDSRADDTTGWIFGTFTYNGALPGKSPWEKLVPVGLMWGNDPKLTVAQVRRGVAAMETVTNSAAIVPFQHLGWAGRLNGPVDNPISSCLSCHAVAQWPAVAPLVPPRSVEQDSAEWMKWFRNVKAAEPFSDGAMSLDYSLQLAVGMQNFYEFQEIIRTKGGADNITAPKAAMFELREQPRPPKTYPLSRSGDE